MDNITQGILGGRISGLWLSQHHRTQKEPLTNGLLRTAAVLTNIGDFDVLIRPLIEWSNPIDAFFFHRGLSHSLLLAVVFALIFWLIGAHFDKAKRARRRRCWAFLSSMVFGHLIIDLMTSYGIRLFLPFSDVILSLDNMFIVDAFFTIPLFILFLCTLFARTTARKRIFAWWGMAFASIYLIATFFAQQYVRTVCTDALTTQGVVIERTYVAPEPLQAFLRRCVARTQRPGAQQEQEWETRFLEDYLSIFDSKHQMFAQQNVRAYSQNTSLTAPFADDPERHRLTNFSQWRRRTEKLPDGKIVIDMLKFGWLIWRDRNRNDTIMFGFMRDPDTKKFSQYSSRGRTISWADRGALRQRVRSSPQE